MRKSLCRVFRSKDVIEDVVTTSHIKFHDNLSIGSDFMPQIGNRSMPVFLVFQKLQSSIELLKSDFPHKMKESLCRAFFSKDVIWEVFATSHIKFHDNLTIGSDFMPQIGKR